MGSGHRLGYGNPVNRLDFDKHWSMLTKAGGITSEFGHFGHFGQTLANIGRFPPSLEKRGPKLP